MADTKISALTAASALTSADLVDVVQSSTNKKATVQQIITAVTGAAGYVGETVTANAPILNMTQTWNNVSITFTALKVNVTSTQSSNTSKLIDLQESSASKFSVDKFGNVISGGITVSAGSSIGMTGAKFNLSQTVINGCSTTTIGWGPTTSSTSTDTCFNRVAAAVIGVRGASSSAGGALEFIEQTAPSAGATNSVRLYAEDNGSGKTKLMALFPTGAAVQIAIEP